MSERLQMEVPRPPFVGFLREILLHRMQVLKLTPILVIPLKWHHIPISTMRNTFHPLGWNVYNLIATGRP